MSNISLDELQIKLKPIFEKYGVERAFVFGSVARGEATRRSVDLLIYTPQEFEAMPRTAFVRRMLRDSKVIYERERESPDGDALDRDG